MCVCPGWLQLPDFGRVFVVPHAVFVWGLVSVGSEVSVGE